MADFLTARQSLADRVATRENVSDCVRDAIAAVPRHEFVPGPQRERAYHDTPLPIGAGQTISAPHVVARMVDRLGIETGDDVLEVGTGSGYHAAVTAEVVGADHVYSVEYDDSLADDARERLTSLGYGDVSIRAGDGHDGWPEHAPYDAAYLTCAAPEFPDAIVAQTRVGGTLLAPLGDDRQHLVRAVKQADGGLARERGVAVRFVPLRGGE